MAQNQKPIIDYSSLSTAKRGAARRFSDLWAITHEIRKMENGRFGIFEIAPKPEPEPKPKPKADILRESTIESPCQVVWEIAEEMFNDGHKRKDIIAACVAKGIAFYTARTQYQKWFATLKNN
jgi:hypothetical protein